MKNLAFLLILIQFLSCKKEEIIDLSEFCNNGDVWYANTSDTFHPNHSIDTFYFNQAAGYHSFVWTSSASNQIQVDVNILPDRGKTILYRNLFVKNIKGTIIGEEFTFDKSKDSVLTITNNGNSFIAEIKSFPIKTVNAKSYDFKACNIRMTDTMP